MEASNYTNNIIAQRWKERYAQLPDAVKEKLDNWDSAFAQLQVIKRKRVYPEIGDIFEVNPTGELFFSGMVVNNHIKNINGDDLLLVLIFRQGVDVKTSIRRGVKRDELLIPPQLVGKEYWTRGYFCNIEHYDESFKLENYGFYSVGKNKFFDEYGNELTNEPQLLGTYGVATIVGIASKINQELIISGII